MKKINMTVSNCNECPFSFYTDACSADERRCSYSNAKLLWSEKQCGGEYSDIVEIPDWCKLENEEATI